MYKYLFILGWFLFLFSCKKETGKSTNQNNADSSIQTVIDTPSCDLYRPSALNFWGFLGTNVYDDIYTDSLGNLISVQYAGVIDAYFGGPSFFSAGDVFINGTKMDLFVTDHNTHFGYSLDYPNIDQNPLHLVVTGSNDVLPLDCDISPFPQYFGNLPDSIEKEGFTLDINTSNTRWLDSAVLHLSDSHNGLCKKIAITTNSKIVFDADQLSMFSSHTLLQINIDLSKYTYKYFSGREYCFLNNYQVTRFRYIK